MGGLAGIVSISCGVLQTAEEVKTKRRGTHTKSQQFGSLVKKDPLLYMARKSWLAQITLAICTTCCRWPSSPSSGHTQNVDPPASIGLQTPYASLSLYHGDKTGVKRQISTHGWVGACTGTRGRGTKALETQDKLLRSYSATPHCSSRHRLEKSPLAEVLTRHTRDTGTPSVLSCLVWSEDYAAPQPSPAQPKLAGASSATARIARTNKVQCEEASS